MICYELLITDKVCLGLQPYTFLQLPSCFSVGLLYWHSNCTGKWISHSDVSTGEQDSLFMIYDMLTNRASPSLMCIRLLALDGRLGPEWPSRLARRASKENFYFSSLSLAGFLMGLLWIHLCVSSHIWTIIGTMLDLVYTTTTEILTSPSLYQPYSIPIQSQFAPTANILS